MRNQRGQVLPLWITSILAMIVFALFIANYAYFLRWRIRAQTAADGAARAALAAQVEEYNSIQTLLFASSVEEIRTRHLIGDLTLLARRSGDCTFTLTWDGACGLLYPRIYAAFKASVGRYTDDVQLMGELTSVKFTDVTTNARNVITGMNTTAVPSDKMFRYTMLNYGPRSDPFRGAWTADEDALTLNPGASGGNYASRFGAGAAGDAFWSPPETEILTCRKIPPFFHAQIFNFTLQSPTMFAIGRAAATAVPITNEWMSPAMMVLNAPGNNALDKTVMLPAESYDSPGYDSGENVPNALAAGRPSYQSDGWYGITFDDYGTGPGANTRSATWNGTTTLPVQGHTFTTAMNWWSTQSIATYLGQLRTDDATLGGFCQ